MLSRRTHDGFPSALLIDQRRFPLPSASYEFTYSTNHIVNSRLPILVYGGRRDVWSLEILVMLGLGWQAGDSRQG